MVDDTINKLYGHLEGRPYSFDDESLLSLRKAAESFIETMWKQIKEIIMIQDNNMQIIAKEDFDVWKSKTGFKLRVQSSRVSLCRLFEQSKQSRKRKRGYDYN